jgi:DNA repair protein RadC
MQPPTNISHKLRPREKFFRDGLNTLTTEELFALIIGSGNRTAPLSQLAKQLTKLFENQTLTIATITKISGMGPAKVAQVLASLELGNRYHVVPKSKLLNSVSDIIPLVEYLSSSKQERLIILTIDGAKRLIGKHLISLGTLNSTLIHPREVYAVALQERAAGIYMIHNHPSQVAQPSIEDNFVTKRIQQAGELLGIPLIDHIIVAGDSYYSYSQQNRLNKL